MDIEAAQQLDDWDNIPECGKKSPENPHASRWGQRVLVPKTGANIVTFKTGGDGGVASYWGLDRRGDVVALVSDVNPLIEPQAVMLKIPRILSVDRGEIRHEVLDRVGVIMEVLPNPRDQTLTVGFFGPGANNAFANFEDPQGNPVTPKPPGKKITRESGTMERSSATLCYSSERIALHQRDAEATLVVYFSTGYKPLEQTP